MAVCNQTLSLIELLTYLLTYLLTHRHTAHTQFMSGPGCTTGLRNSISRSLNVVYTEAFLTNLACLISGVAVMDGDEVSLVLCVTRECALGAGMCLMQGEGLNHAQKHLYCIYYISTENLRFMFTVDFVHNEIQLLHRRSTRTFSTYSTRACSVFS